jgi:hypothetical protein
MFRKTLVRRFLVLMIPLLVLSSSPTRAAVSGEIAKGWVLYTGASTLPAQHQYSRRWDVLSESPYRKPYVTGTVTVNRIRPGDYRVTFPNLGVVGGTAHVTAYGGNHHCKVANTPPPGNMDKEVLVSCYNSMGQAADGGFTVFFYKDSVKRVGYGHAYFHSNSVQSSGCSAGAPSWGYNSRSGLNRVCILGIGEYEVVFSKMFRDPSEPLKGGTVLVTAYGNTAGVTAQRCKVRNWVERGEDVVVRIGCSQNGVPVISRFNVSFTRGAGYFGMQHTEDSHEDFYVWADGMPSPNDYYQSNSYGNGGATVAETLGRYRVTLPGMATNRSTMVQVSAYGNDNAHCTITSWNPGSSNYDAQVSISCHGDNGAPAASSFALYYGTSQLIFY